VLLGEPEALNAVVLQELEDEAKAEAETAHLDLPSSRMGRQWTTWAAG